MQENLNSENNIYLPDNAGRPKLVQKDTIQDGSQTLMLAFEPTPMDGILKSKLVYQSATILNSGSVPLTTQYLDANNNPIVIPANSVATLTPNASPVGTYMLNAFGISVPTLLQVLANGNVSTPNTATKPIIQFNDSGVLTSNPVEGAIEVIKGTDQLNPNLDGGGFNFTRYSPLFGTIRERLFENVFSHGIGRVSNSRTQVLLDTAINKYSDYNKSNILIRVFPFMFGTPSGTPEVINISFDNQATWNLLWQGNTAGGGSQSLVGTTIDIMLDAYYNKAGYNAVTDTFNSDGSVTTTKQFKQISNTVTTGNIYLQFVLSGSENVGVHYEIHADREQSFGTP